jgi:hypothetical protein
MNVSEDQERRLAGLEDVAVQFVKLPENFDVSFGDYFPVASSVFVLREFRRIDGSVESEE